VTEAVGYLVSVRTRIEKHTKIKQKAFISRRLVSGFPWRWPGFRPMSNFMGFVVNNVALGQIFSEYLAISSQSSFHRLLHAHLSSGAGTVGQLVADVPSGLSLVPLHEVKKIIIYRQALI
jgi:hypothetical protein